VTFPSFRSPKTYQLYKKTLAEDWHRNILQLSLIIILIEVSKLIEDFFIPDLNIKNALEYKIAKWATYILMTLCRYCFIIRCNQYRETFLDRTDVLSFLILIAVFIVTNRWGFYSQSVHPLWVSKLTLRSIGIFLCLSLTFYNWFFVPLTWTFFLALGAYWNQRAYSQDVMYWLPSYTSMFIGVWVICYSRERIKRTNFERHTLGLGDKDVWKRVINNLPHGLLAVNKDREILYSNEALYSMLNISPSLNFKSLNDLNSIAEIKITNYDARSQCEPEAPELLERNDFINLQQDIWKKWDFLSSYFQTAPRTDYLYFRGTTFKPIARANKLLDIRLCMREISGQDVLIFTFLDIPDIILVNMLSQALNYRSNISNEDRFDSVLDELDIKEGLPVIDRLNEGKEVLSSLLIPFEIGRGMINKSSFRSKNSSKRRKKSIGDLAKPSCQCPQVLIADDDAFVILSFENILSSLSYTFTSCYNGQQALELVEKRIESPCCGFCRPFTVIFLDSRMPMMDGYECTRKLQEIFKKRPEYRSPIIILEPFNPFDSAKKKRLAKVDGTCSKPIAKNDIEKIVNFYSKYDVKDHLNITCI